MCSGCYADPRHIPYSLWNLPADMHPCACTLLTIYAPSARNFHMIIEKETESEGYIIMNRNSDILILLVLLVLFAEFRDAQGPYPAQGFVQAPNSALPPGRSPRRLRMPEPVRLIGDLHRMTEVMGKVDRLGQMAVNPPKLPEPAELINTSALPDLGGMMDMLGSLLGRFGDTSAE